MSWKYVVVGLTLVLLGNLLVIEGRENHGFENAADLSSLLNYLRSRQLVREPYDVDVTNEEAAIQGLENSEDPVSGNSNQNPEPASTVMTSQTEGEKGHNSGSSGEGGGGNIGRGRGGSEIGARVEGSPQALPLTHRGGVGNSLDDTTTKKEGIAFIVLVAGCTVLAAIGMVGAGVCWYKYHKRAKAAGVVDYPAYGVTGPTKDHLPSPGDRKLAQSAQMYHYQHQKQQMIAMEKANGSMKHDASDEESEEDNVEGDYTVYECPGLAPTGEMEVKNPLFRGDETPSTPVNEEPPPPQDK